MSTSEIIQQMFEDAVFAIVNALDNTKRFIMDLSGAATGKTVTLKSNHQDNITLTLPDKTGTLERLEADREENLTNIIDYTTSEIVDINMTHSFTVTITNPIQGKSMLLVVIPNGFTLSLPASTRIISGRFKNNVTNYIYFHCINDTIDEYIVTIGQQQA